MSIYIYKVSSKSINPLGADAPVRLCSYYCNASQLNSSPFSLNGDKSKYVDRINAAHKKNGDAKYIAVGDQFEGSNVYIPKHNGALLDDTDFGTHIGILLKVRGKYKLLNKDVSKVYNTEIKLNYLTSGRITRMSMEGGEMNPEIYREKYFFPLLNALSPENKADYALVRVPH